ncbi:hypothetical protein DYB32_001630 [Aphanomyces invadans]|uniref:EamA domain-containing protein n=1 Tax=Aphanomyces invadans TaxID=157072 RepID=A0A3R6W296_9STRA|nr:hypothetical protein DYB32_001630 [Aphanomyces invadans]
MMGVTWTYALLGAATLLCGAMGTILMKVQFSMTVEGTVICRDGATNDSTTHCPFHKPWFGVLQMKIAMTMCLIYLLIRQKVTGKPYLESPVFKRKHFGAKYMPQPRSYEERRTLLQEAYDGPSWRTMLFLVFPALLDLINTTLAFTGLLWVPASVYQMSNGAVLLFSAFIAMRFMGRDLYCYQILSILLVAFAVIIFSVAGILGGDHNAVSPLEIYTNITTTYELPTIPVTTSDVHQAVGMAFILLGQVALAAQFAVEEHFMVERHVSPLLLVGMEGAWGLVLFIGLVPVLGMTPASDAITAQLWHEDFSDTWVKLKSSPSLLCLVLAYMLSIGTYNVRLVVPFAKIYMCAFWRRLRRSMSPNTSHPSFAACLRY